MIILQDELDTRPVKVDWYWSEKRPEVDDGNLREVHPFFVIQESRYIWEEVSW
jgi:hypothetical protein